VLLKQNSAAQAVRVLERAVKVDPAWPQGFALLGRAYMLSGRRDDARRAFDAARRLSEEERKRLEEKVSKPKS
jgi:cytochrome c-type biogenesis protein CcmH/NrfG